MVEEVGRVAAIEEEEVNKAAEGIELAGPTLLLAGSTWRVRPRSGEASLVNGEDVTFANLDEEGAGGVLDRVRAVDGEDGFRTNREQAGTGGVLDLIGLLLVAFLTIRLLEMDALGT